MPPGLWPSVCSPAAASARAATTRLAGLASPPSDPEAVSAPFGTAVIFRTMGDPPDPIGPMEPLGPVEPSGAEAQEERAEGRLSRAGAMVRGLAIDVTPLRRSRDFRLLWTGQLISLTGRQITTVAVPFQVFVLTRSSL